MQKDDVIQLVDLFYSQEMTDAVVSTLRSVHGDVLDVILGYYQDNAIFTDIYNRQWKLCLSNVDEPVLLGLTKDTPTFYLPQVRGIIIQGFRVKMGYQNQEEVPF